MLSLCVAHLVMLTWSRGHAYPRKDHWSPGLSFGGALRRTPASAIVGLLSAMSLAPVLTLAAYHTRLLLLNRSTVEQIRVQAARKVGANASGLDEETAGDNPDDPGEPQHQHRSFFQAMTTALTAPCLVLLPGGEHHQPTTTTTSRRSKRRSSRAQNDPNPYSRPDQHARNILNTLARPYSYSWIDRRGWFEPDLRETNPAFLPAPSPPASTASQPRPWPFHGSNGVDASQVELDPWGSRAAPSNGAHDTFEMRHRN